MCVHEQDTLSSVKMFSTGSTLEMKVRMGAKIRNHYNQVTHLTQDTTSGKVTKTQLNFTNESKEVSPFPAGDHKAAMNRRESMTNTRQK